MTFSILDENSHLVLAIVLATFAIVASRRTAIVLTTGLRSSR